mmetsp:Transcript_57490/g.138858  ORF Transcript_57490/g.138858 Transcript_57490/m.138858 type:complete len:98 (-) Transcript_57490:2355-2648(-)
MTVNIKTLTGKTIRIEGVDARWSVVDLKLAVEKEEEIPVDQQRLIHSGKALDKEGDTLASYGVKHGSVLHLVLRIPKLGALGSVNRIKSGASRDVVM